MPRPKFNKLFPYIQVLLALLCLVAPAVAQSDDEDHPERIHSFDSHIELSPDGSMNVRETIEVEAAGIQIRHGIYRDFRTRYRDHWGNGYSVLFEIVAVERDGNPEPYHTEGISNGVRVYFGDSHTLVSEGRHRYVFAYVTNRQLGFFKDHDELYWNVTGVGWGFPIDRATATVVLPPQIHNFVTKLDGYTGAEGEQGKEFTATHDADGNPYFETQNLLPHQGLTIAVSWPKGLIAPPSREQKLKWFLQDNLATGVGLIGLVIVFAYYLIIWMKVGRDPKAGTIVPLYEPPDNTSPASMRYLEHMAFDDKCFTSDIMALAAKGYLKIEQEGSHSYRLVEKTDAGKYKGQLSSDERTLKQKLFEDGSPLELKNTNASVISRARKALSTDLHTGMEKTYFVTNAGYLWPGLALTIVSGVGMLIALGFQPQGGGQVAVAVFMTIWLSGWSIGVGALLHAVFRAWKGARSSPVVGGTGALGITLFSIPFVIGEVVGLGVLAWAVSIPAMVMIVALIISNALFHHLLKAPTRAGRQLLDRIDGFKMFLSAVDGPRLSTVAPPDKNPELFERFLPYALALGVEHAWGEQFSQVLAASAGGTGSTATRYSPSWYSGAVFASSPEAFSSSFSDSFSSAVSASSSPPGSSSGGGGGGSSGGGGGGGGGGGW
jgi:uncharacterized membrane protein YgcG